MMARAHRVPGATLLLLIAALSVAAMAVPGLAQDVQPKLEITSDPDLRNAILRSEYGEQLLATGGEPPWTWNLVDGSLPAGLNLDPTSGLVTGTPHSPGQYRFVVEITDSADPPHTLRREFSLRVVSAFTIEWKSPPQATADGIYGSMNIVNQTPEDVDLTLIAVAVNEIGKAFALGYQHFKFAKDSTVREITIGSNLPRGTYIVHVDAVAEVADKNLIYRTHLQTEEPLSTER